jgi:dTDP-4-amino-4,6-dideoxygalactose transaminase
MSNAHAKLVRASLKDVYRNMAERRRLEARYDAACPDEWRMPPRAAPWVYDLRLPGTTSEKQSEVVRELNAQGVAARHCFKPMSSQPEFMPYGPPSPNATRLSREVIYLPLTPFDGCEVMPDHVFGIISRVLSD